jgi:hypothetical protein
MMQQVVGSRRLRIEEGEDVIAHVHSVPRSERADSVVEKPANARTAQQKSRDDALDWVKGALVVLMVVYHSVNYSVYPHLASIYMGFLPVSFIFMAGFFLTNHYLAKYDLKDWRLHRRLVIRGAKLIVLFSALNLGLYFMASGRSFLQRFSENFPTIYLGAEGHVASFPILTSIGYLLLLAPLLLAIGSLNRRVLPALAVALVIFCSLLDWKGSVGYHLGMISAGIIGTAFGFMPLKRIAGYARKSFIVISAYCAYRACSYFIGEPYAVQMTGVVSTLLLFYGVALKLKPGTHILKETVLLGRYSLFGYITQLGIIQVTVRLSGPIETPLAIVTLASFVLIATWAATVFVDRLRARAPLVDVTYKAAFA